MEVGISDWYLTNQIGTRSTNFVLMQKEVCTCPSANPEMMVGIWYLARRGTEQVQPAKMYGEAGAPVRPKFPLCGKRQQQLSDE